MPCVTRVFVFKEPSWTQRTPASSPTIRHQHAMADDSMRGVTLQFGGYWSYFVGSTQRRIWYGETWEYAAASEPDVFAMFLPLALR
jgi:hypothetical protein